MSYTRWSTDIKNTIPWEELGFLIKNGAYTFRKKLQHRRHAEISDWYIFWHMAECIAIYHKQGDGAQCYDFDDVIYMYNSKDYSMLPIVTQEDYLHEVLGRVVEDILEEAKDE